MAENNDYQLEEMENSAVSKSAMAKRMAAGAGLLAAGAATAYGAEQLVGDDGNNVATDHVQQPDLSSGAAAGAVGEGVAEQTQSKPEPEPQVVRTEERVDMYVHPDPQPAPEPEMEFDSTTHLYDDDGNLVGTVDGGSYAGKDFAILDHDADGHGDVLWYDENGDGKITQNELSDISDANYAMGSHGGTHHDINVNTGEEVYLAHTPVDDPYGDSIADIHNDYDEKSGEEYSEDLAQNNPDYRNHEDTHQYDQYHAGTEVEEGLTGIQPNHGLEYGPEIEDYSDDAQDNALYADADTLDDDNTDEYALNDDDNLETSDDSDLAYNDDDYSADDSADEDMAYNDDVQNDDVDDNIDDTAQYDIV